jgi:dTDP-4-dehydrorhamnose reductase
MKVAVLGATGMLGSMLVKYLRDYFKVVATARDTAYEPPSNVEFRHLEVAIKDGLLEAIEDCQWVINAIGAIPQRKSSATDFMRVNTSFPMVLANVAGQAGCQVIQITTDCVFSGDKGNYTEQDRPNPVDGYGESKSFGEVKSPSMHHLRCSIVGPETHGKSLLGWFLSQPEGATIPGYTNHYWNGITTLHFARICRGIIENSIKLPHLQHIVPADSVSKYKLLKLFASEFGREDMIIDPIETIEPVHRTLATNNDGLNRKLWKAAGYDYLPTIARMIMELRRFCGDME